MQTSHHENLEIYVEPTPNPNAFKFILNRIVKTTGKAGYKTPSECGENLLAAALFTIRGVDQVHFFENVITISKFSYEEWDAIEPQVRSCLEEKIQTHNPDFKELNPELERREALSPDLQKIEEILDHTIRPGLQGDGGDLVCLSYDKNILMVKYQGACGTCPSSSAGTLEAIKGILRDQFNPEIEVYIQPQ
ncbi:MAG: NifU family protein [Bacteriovoracaceae bacterium]|nr:NifU family protein [Bacteriovoracaceae bacterium]